MRYKILAISYGDSSFSMSRDLNLWTAKHIGRATSVRAYNREDIGEDFYKENEHILNMPRGGGYWLWKPYIILKGLETIQYGEYLIYTDAGMIFSHSLECLVKHMEKEKTDIFISTGFAPTKDWCKRDAFILMDCDTVEAAERIIVSGGYVLLRKTDSTIEFIKEWLMYAKDERIITDCENTLGLPNYEGFHEHRHDQAILSNLCYKHGIETYKGVSHVDEPRSHLRALKGDYGSYGYTFEQRIELIKKAHKSPGYMKSKYPRIFINTRIKNCNPLLFGLKLVKKILYVVYIDLWGMLFDKRYLDEV